MNWFFLKVITYFFLLSLIFIGCGPRIQKENLSAEEYFEYAKGILDKGKCMQAQTEFTLITLKFSGNPIVDDAQFYLAESHFDCEEYLIAVAEYQKLVNDYPESPYVEKAFYKIGVSFFNLSQRPELDQEYTMKALRQFQNFVEAYPTHEYRNDAEHKLFELRVKLAKKQLLGGNIYRKMGIFDSAVIYYNILLEKYYDTPQAEEAMFFKGECLFKLKKYNQAITNFTAFVEKYPKSKFTTKAKQKITAIQELLAKEDISQSEFDD